MMTFLTIICTIALILTCLLVGLLVLVQLPKKEAGAAMAFGGGATDTLFGAGSGNMLTKWTRNLIIVFFVLVIVLSILKKNSATAPGSDLRKALTTAPAGAPITTEPLASAPPPAASSNAVPATNAGSFNLQSTAPPAPAAGTNAATNLLAVPIK